MEYRLINFEKELKELSELYQKSWTTTYIGLLPDQLLKSFTIDKSIDKWIQFNQIKDSFIYVAIEKNELGMETICGFAACTPDDELLNTGYLYSLHIKKEHFKRGIGKGLIMKVSKYFIEKGINSLTLCVVVGNDNAYNVYMKLGAEILKYKTSTYQIGTTTNEVILIWRDLNKLLNYK